MFLQHFGFHRKDAQHLEDKGRHLEKIRAKMTKRLQKIAKHKYNVVGKIQIEMASSSCLLLTPIADHASTKTYFTFSQFFVHVQSDYKPGTLFLRGVATFLPTTCMQFLFNVTHRRHIH